jgi:general secretion pathway protein N
MMRRWLWLVAAFLVGAVVLLPLRAVLALGNGGLAARTVTGSLGSGQLAAAAWRGVALGDLDVGLAPLSLLTGTPALHFAGPALAGTATPAGVSGLSGSVDAGGQTPLPIGRIGLQDVEIAFDKRVCTQARGMVTVAATGSLATALGGSLQGLARCDGGALLLPLASATAQLLLRIGGDGSWRAVISVTSVDEATRTGLLAAGFAPTPQGLSRTLEGHL